MRWQSPGLPAEICLEVQTARASSVRGLRSGSPARRQLSWLLGIFLWSVSRAGNVTTSVRQWQGKKTAGVSPSRTLTPPTCCPPKRKGIFMYGSVVWFPSSRWAISAPLPLLYFLGQVSVLTDQVEAQGEKIRDLEVCLEGHQVKLNAAEEMLQQVRAWGLKALGL